MADREGGQWNVASKGGAIYLERVSEDGEQLFEDALDAESARAFGELLIKHAGKVNDSDRSDDDDSDEDSDKSEDDDDDDDDDDSDDDGDDSDDDDDESGRKSK